MGKNVADERFRVGGGGDRKRRVRGFRDGKSRNYLKVLRIRDPSGSELTTRIRTRPLEIYRKLLIESLKKKTCFVFKVLKMLVFFHERFSKFLRRTQNKKFGFYVLVGSG